MTNEDIERMFQKMNLCLNVNKEMKQAWSDMQRWLSEGYDNLNLDDPCEMDEETARAKGILC